MNDIYFYTTTITDHLVLYKLLGKSKKKDYTRVEIRLDTDIDGDYFVSKSTTEWYKGYVGLAKAKKFINHKEQFFYFLFKRD
jgi:hypothetical protein